MILILGIPFLLSLFFFPFRVFLLLLLLCAGLDLLSSTCFGIFDGFGIGMYGKKRTCMVWYGMVRLLVLVLA